MTWTYDSSAPGDTDRDQIRLMIGDVDTTDQQLTDEEIAYYVTTYTTVGASAVAAARAIMARYARLVSKSVGDLRISLSDRHTHYKELVAYLESVAESSDPWQVYAGGQSVAEIDADDADTDLPTSSFRRGQFDIPRRSPRDPFVT